MLPEQAAKIIEAARYYMDLFPQSDRNALLTYTNGQILVRYGENEKARAEFQSGWDVVHDALLVRTIARVDCIF